MRKIFTMLSVAFISTAFSQPVISNGNNIPAAGLSAPFSSNIASSGTGNAGANQTWNYSALAFSTSGTVTTIDPASSTFSSAFSSANYAYVLANTYSYFKSTGAKTEVQAYSITSPGSGNDYTPNPRTLLKFPFNFGDTETDTWQKVNGSVNTVTLTYDGYGTLIMPARTYSNVVRVKEDYGNGAIDYQWYILNPLMSVLAYNNGGNMFYHTAATQLVNTGISPNSILLPASVFPNPATNKFTLELPTAYVFTDLKFNMINFSGEQVKEILILSHLSEINLTGIAAGIYLYTLQNNEGILKTGKIIVE
ncbi:MAG: T9SS type A sorting domain-containing protein [Bacteroidota bacterium]